MTVLFFGSSSFSVPALRAIQDSVDCVVTKKTKPKGRGYLLEDNEIKREALSLGLPLVEIESFRDEEAKQIGDLNPDLLVVASFGIIVPKWFLDIPSIGAINVHPSLLPAHRGPSPIQWAIWNGDKETGITIMKMNARMDAGDILYQEPFAIEHAEDAESLTCRLAVKAAQLLPSVIQDARTTGIQKGIPQDDDKATYTRMITKEMGKINWQTSSAEIDRQIRALVSWPTAYTFLENKMLKVFKARPSTSTVDDILTPGTVVRSTSEGIEVSTGQGVLLVEDIQIENRRRMRAADFARGYRQISGRQLG
jgi:methionyl-tRNA formyltransferase